MSTSRPDSGPVRSGGWRVWTRDARWTARASVWIAGVTVVLAPMLVCLIYMAFRDYWPGGDEAYIGVRAMEVWSWHPPLTGMRSTSIVDPGAVQVHHPGPLQFYVLAGPLALCGFHPWGLLLGAWLLAAYVVWVAVRCAYGMWRLPGVVVVVAAFLVLELVVGLQFLLRPWNPTTALFPLVALPVLFAAMWAGRVRWMPHLAFLWSYVAQAHLAYLPLTVCSGMALAILGIVRWHRVRGEIWPLPGSVGWRGRGRGWATVVVFVLCWLPVAVEGVLYSPDNVLQMWRYLTTSHGATIGPLKAVSVMSALAAPTYSSLGGLVAGTSSSRHGGTAAAGALLLVVIVVAVVLAAVRWRRGAADTLDRLMLILGATLLVVLVTISRIEVTRSLVYALVFAPLMVLAEITALGSLGRALLRAGRPARRPGSPLLLVVCGLVTVALCVVLPTRSILAPSTWDTGAQTRADAQVTLRALDRAGLRGRVVRIDTPGPVGFISLAAGIGYGLSQHDVGWTKNLVWTLPTDDQRHESQHAPANAAVLTIREHLAGRWYGAQPTKATLISDSIWPERSYGQVDRVQLWLQSAPTGPTHQ